MANLKRYITILTAALLSCTALCPKAVQAQTMEDHAVPVEPESISISGRFVLPDDLPAGVVAKDFSFERIFSNFQVYRPEIEPPYPADFEGWDDQRKADWMEAFENSPEYRDYENKKNERQRAILNTPLLPIDVASDGSFTIHGLEPGQYQMFTMLRHAKVPTEALGEHSQIIEVKAGQDHIDLGELEVRVLTVLLPGQDAPNFEAQMLDGNTFELLDYRGKFVVLCFWTSWYIPCDPDICGPSAMMRVDQVFKEYGDQDNFQVIRLSADSSIKDLENYDRNNPTPYLQGYIGPLPMNEGEHNEILESYGIRGIPSIWLIGPDGKIIERSMNRGVIVERIQRALAQHNNEN